MGQPIMFGKSSGGYTRYEDYLRVVTAEQIQARITPRQATPFFLDKLVQLAQYIDRELSSSTIFPIQRFILARDQAYFKAVFFSGDRPADIGQVTVPEILRFLNDDGFLFNHVWSKTLRDGDANMFLEYAETLILPCARLLPSNGI